MVEFFDKTFVTGFFIHFTKLQYLLKIKGLSSSNLLLLFELSDYQFSQKWSDL